MGGAKNCPETPRQKMISMMYLVLTAMLALNVSAEILNGYNLVNDSMKRNVVIGEGKIDGYNAQFEGLMQTEKAKAELVKASVDSVNAKSDAFCAFIGEIQQRIIQLADKNENATDTTTLENLGDTNIPSQVGLTEKKGGELKKMMDEYAAFMMSVDTLNKEKIAKTFSTEPIKKKGDKAKNWDNSIFEDMPSIASVAVLTKIKSDVRAAQADALADLIGAMDANDFRVNRIQALAVPKSSYVLKGDKYSASILLAATDSTKEPEIIINGTPLPAGKNVYEVSCPTVGNKKYTGEMILTKKDGTKTKYSFSQEYMVAEPTATVSADLMNVLYAGFKNPVSVSAPGFSASEIQISATNCKSQIATSTGWTIVPQTVGTPCKISVSAKKDGKVIPIATKQFRVKKLPDPLAMIEYVAEGGRKERYKGGKPIAKNLLITARKIVAELDDADLDVKYKVLEFSMNSFDSMGNTLVEKTSGDALNDRMMKTFREMTRQKSVFITNVMALGQDGLKRTLPPVEVKIK